jgi:hypothetical protein
VFTALYRMARHRFARRRCALCGCTDWKACPGGCAWLTGSIDVCTACRPGSSAEADAAWRAQLAAMPPACRTAIEEWEGPLEVHDELAPWPPPGDVVDRVEASRRYLVNRYGHPPAWRLDVGPLDRSITDDAARFQEQARRGGLR